jgi:hypothetical protein
MDFSSMPVEPLEPAGKGAVTMSSKRGGASDEQGGGDEDDYERSLGHGRGCRVASSREQTERIDTPLNAA